MCHWPKNMSALWASSPDSGVKRAHGNGPLLGNPILMSGFGDMVKQNADVCKVPLLVLKGDISLLEMKLIFPGT